MRTLRGDEFDDYGEHHRFDEIAARLGFFGTNDDIVSYGRALLQSPESAAAHLPKDTRPLPYLSSLIGRHLTAPELFGEN